MQELKLILVDGSQTGKIWRILIGGLVRDHQIVYIIHTHIRDFGGF